MLLVLRLDKKCLNIDIMCLFCARISKWCLSDLLTKAMPKWILLFIVSDVIVFLAVDLFNAFNWSEHLPTRSNVTS
jgi:Flp pilus assembly protein protease CpaA